MIITEGIFRYRFSGEGMDTNNGRGFPLTHPATQRKSMPGEFSGRTLPLFPTVMLLLGELRKMASANLLKHRSMPLAGGPRTE
jgi:hypothetical protein